MMSMIKKVTTDDYIEVAKLAKELWENNNLEDLEQEYLLNLGSDKFSVFLYYINNVPIAFAQCQLRYDYVEGTKTSPVGYIEGIYVKEEYRPEGIAKEMLKSCEDWARKMNCTEMASDCELENNMSLEFHKKCGFREANRVICFTKKL